MLVTDRVELQSSKTVTIDTSKCRLSFEPCGHTLNSRKRSGSVYDKKPTIIYSRASQTKRAILGLAFFMHYSCSGRCTLC